MQKMSLAEFSEKVRKLKSNITEEKEITKFRKIIFKEYEDNASVELKFTQNGSLCYLSVMPNLATIPFMFEDTEELVDYNKNYK